MKPFAYPRSCHARAAVLAALLCSAAAVLAASPANADAPVAPPAPDAVTTTATPGKGVTFKSNDGRYSLNIKGRIQIRDTVLNENDTFANEIQIKTLRLSLSGNVLNPNIKYLIQFAFATKDFEKDNVSPIFDAYVEFAHFRDFTLRVGQYFVPFDRARTTREFALQFVDRQQPVRELTLDRDAGLMLYSQDLGGLGGILAYNLFVGGGDGRNHFGGETMSPIVVGRFSLRPMGAFDDDQEGDLTRSPTPHLALGIAGAYNPETHRAQSTYGNVITLGTFNYAHAAADVVFKYAGFSLSAEALVRSADRDSYTGTVAGATVTQWSREAWGYFAQSGMMLTDELEVVARWDQLVSYGAATDPELTATIQQYGKQVGGGVNWYLNGHAFKVQADYFYAFGEVGDGRHTARLQLDATF